jgi:cysteine desulfuration protein SufE
MALPEKLQEMINELNTTDDPTEKYEVLIEIGAKLPDIPADQKIPANLIHGCQSVVHVYGECAGGKLKFYGHGDAMVVNGMTALLVLGLSGLTPEEFLAVDPEFFKLSGVVKTLTPSRVNGFYNMHQRMKEIAEKFAKEGC